MANDYLSRLINIVSKLEKKKQARKIIITDWLKAVKIADRYDTWRRKRMSLNRYAKRKDSNHRAICDLFKAEGCTVFEPDEVDAVVGFRGKNFLFEIKSPGKRNQLKPRQVDFLKNWQGQYSVIESFEEGMQVLLKGEFKNG